MTDLVHEVTQDLPKLMLEELKKSLCIGLDDTQVKLIMPKEIPDEESGGDEFQFQRLIEKLRRPRKRIKTVSMQRCGVLGVRLCCAL